MSPGKKKKAGILPLSKTLLDSDVWEQGSLAVQLWIWMLMTAVHSPEGYTLNNKKFLKRGQLWTTYRLMSKALRYRWARGYKAPPIATLKTIIDRWLAERQIELLIEHSGMIVTLSKYELYNNLKIIGGTIDGTIGKRLIEQEEGTTQREEDKTHTEESTSPEKFWAEQAVEKMLRGPRATRPARRKKAVATVMAVLTEDMAGDPDPMGRLGKIIDFAAQDDRPGFNWRKYLKCLSVLRAMGKNGGMRWENIEQDMKKSHNQGEANGRPEKESFADFNQRLERAAQSLSDNGMRVVVNETDQDLLPESADASPG